MTDISKIGIASDTGPLKDLNTQLDTTKQKVRDLNQEISQVNSQAASAASGLDKVADSASNLNKTASDAGKSVGDVGDKAAGAKNKLADLAQGGSTLGDTYKKVSDVVNDAKEKIGNLGASTDGAKSKMAGLAASAADTGSAMSRAGSDVKTAAGALDQNLTPAVQKATGFFSAFAQAFRESFVAEINKAKAPIADATNYTQKLEEYVKSTGLSYQTASQYMKEANTAQSALGQEAQKSGGIFSSLKDYVTGFGSQLRGTTTSVAEHAGKTKEMAAEHGRASEAAKMARESLHTMEPILDSVGVKMASMTQFSGASRAGLGALAVAIAGTVLIELQKLADEADTVKTRLEGLAGVKIGDQLAASFEKAAESAGHLPKALEASLESLTRFQQLHGPENMVPPSLTGGFESLGVSAQKSLDTIQTLYEQIRLGGATSEQAVAATNRFFGDLAKTGSVTAQMLEDLGKASPATAQAISNVFTQGRMNAAQFEEVLAKTPMTFRSIEQAMRSMQAATREAYADMIANPTTVDAALEKLQNKLKDVGITVKEALKLDPNSPGFVTQAISAAADKIGQLNSALRGMDQSGRLGAVIQIFKDIGSVVGAVFGPVLSVLSRVGEAMMATSGAFLDNYISIRDTVLNSGKAIVDFVTSSIASISSFVSDTIAAIENWGSPFVEALLGGLDKALTAISNFVGQAKDKFLELVDAAVSAAEKVASALAKIATGQAGASGQQTASDVMSMAMGNGTMPQQSQGALGSGSPADEGLPGFATGGSFTVGGSGGTDTQLIQFMATPGEKITIDPPNMAQGGSGATLGALIPASGNDAGGGGAPSDLASASYSNALKQQTADLKTFEGDNRDRLIVTISNTTAQIVAQLKSMSLSGTSAAASSAGSSSSGSSSTTSGTTASGAAGGGGGGLDNEPADSSFSTRQKSQASSQSSASPQLPPLSPAQALAMARLEPGFSSYGEAKSIGNGFADQVSSGGGKPPDKKKPADYTQQNVARNPDGTPVGSPTSDSLPETSTIRTFGAGGVREAVVPKEATQAVEKQTTDLKQSQDQTSRSVADAVKQQANDSKSIGAKTNQSLDSVQKSTADSMKSLGDVSQATTEGTDATVAGTDATKETTDATKAGTDATTGGFTTANQSLDQVQTAAQATSEGVGQTTDAVSSGSNSIVEALSSAASSIADAVSNAVSSIAEKISSQTAPSSSTDNNSSSSSSGDTSGGFSSDGAAVAVGDGTAPAMATGGQFQVKGPGHTDTELVQFYASPGETVTITPPSGTPPPNPSFDSHPTGSAKKAYAIGGQTTLGSMFGTPTLGKAAGDIVTSSIADMIKSQQANISGKIDDVGARLTQTIAGSTSSIQSAISSVSGQIPDPVAPVAASPSGGSGNSGSGKGGFDGLDPFVASQVKKYGMPQNPAIAAMLLGPQYVASYPGANPADAYRARNGYATGGQFSVGSRGIRGFATGGQVTAGNDNTDASTSPDTVASTVSAKSSQETGGIKQSLDTMAARFENAMNAHTNTITAGINNIGSRLGAWKNSVTVSAKTASASTGLAEGGVITVPGGQSGTDSVDVQVKAAPGEKIMVLPPEEAEKMKRLSSQSQKIAPEPLKNFFGDNKSADTGQSFSDFASESGVPGRSAAMSGGRPAAVPGNDNAQLARHPSAAPYSDMVPASPSSQAGQDADKKVTIVVQQGVSADTFIRSRAEISRAMR